MVERMGLRQVFVAFTTTQAGRLRACARCAQNNLRALASSMLPRYPPLFDFLLMLRQPHDFGALE